MTLSQFLLHVPKWSIVEANERIGLDFTKFLFVAAVSLIALFIREANQDSAAAVEDVASWVVYTFPAAVIAFVLYALWVGLTVSWRFWRERSGFRFEVYERNNFVEKFNQALGDTDIDGGTF